MRKGCVRPDDQMSKTYLKTQEGEQLSHLTYLKLHPFLTELNNAYIFRVLFFFN